MGQNRGHSGAHGCDVDTLAERLELRALLPARHRRHPAALQPLKIRCTLALNTASIRGPTNRVGSGTPGFRPIARQERLTTHIAWRGVTIPLPAYRFDSQKILLDPFAPAVFFPPDYDRIAAGLPGPNDGRAPLGVLPKIAPSLAPEWRPSTPAKPRSDRLRTARQGLHGAGKLRRHAWPPRDVCRLDRKNTLPQETGNYRRGIDADPSVRSRRKAVTGDT